jgi:Tfp pilus assembly protein PilF
MHKNGRVALQGSSWGQLFPLLLFLVIGTTIGEKSARAADDAAACQPPIARVVSIQGSVEAQRSQQSNWSTVTRLDTPVCAGDKLRTGSLSRAALFIQPETLVRVDENTTISINETPEETVVEFVRGEIAATASEQRPHCGAGYFITRFPKKFKVNTPFFNAAVEGTEFQVAMRCESSELSVFEGKVRAQILPTREEQLLTSGQTLASGPSTPAVIKALIKPADAVQWLVYYPPLTDAKSAAEVPAAEQCHALPSPSDQSCLTQRAEGMLRFGRIDEALHAIDEALALNSENADATALRVIVQIAGNDKTAAMQSATAATASSPNSYRAWLALSYAQQTAFELEQALASAEKALALEPGSSLVRARIAELLMSLGKIKEAETAARSAVDANPVEARAHTVLGFVHLAQINTKAARADFAGAIERDSFDPLPRLGLGLAVIRDGKLAEGRAQIEIAVALDPSNSLLRSYVGKAYYEENSGKRDDLADAQFGLAKQLDSKDPTPWFYGAILKRTQNMPVEALQDLQTSVEKNDNRAVYRSRLLLDDDAAARTASAAAVYYNLGFEKLAIVESAKALAENAGNDSAHRQLAGAYGNLPRHDIARVSEALQAQIRQPVSISPVAPQLDTDNLAIVRDTGPSRPGTNEFNLLFNQDQTRVQFDGVVGGRNTLAEQFLISGLANTVSYSLSQLHYKTDGFVDNDAAEKNIYDLFVQDQISTNASVQVDAKRSDFKVGQTFFAFDPVSATPTTIIEHSDAFRFSGHYVLDAGNDWIWSAVVEDRNRAVESFPDGGLFTNSDASPFAVEVQRLSHIGSVQLVTGLGYVEVNEHFRLEQVDVRTESANAYVYAQWQPSRYAVSLEAGLAAEWFKSRSSAAANDIDRNRLSPKIGLVWSPRTGTTLRAAAFSSVRRPFVRSQTIEPTQVVGFNQFFTGFEQFYGDLEGTVSRRVGVAVDQAFSSSAFAGAEVASRHLDVPSLNLDQDFTWRETTAHVYLYRAYAPGLIRWLSGSWQAALSAEGEYERVERPQIFSGSEGIVELKTTRAPIGVRLFNSKGTTVRLSTTYVRQEGAFSVDVGLPVTEKNDQAWITDISLEYRLPTRLGVIAIGVRNAFDNFIDLVEIDPLNPRVATRQLVFGAVRLVF